MARLYIMFNRKSMLIRPVVLVQVLLFPLTPGPVMKALRWTLGSQLGVLLCPMCVLLTHWGWATHTCVSKLIIIASDNGLSPGRHQAIIWNNAGILSIGLLWTNFSEISIEILTFSFKKMHLKVSSVKWRPFCLGLNVLTHWPLGMCGSHLKKYNFETNYTKEDFGHQMCNCFQ